jgi:hypothetical protein
MRAAAADLNPAAVESVVAGYITGWFLLVKELAAAFTARGAGTLAMVLADTGGTGPDEPDLMGPSVAASFRAFADGLLAASPACPYDVYAFTAPAYRYAAPAAGEEPPGAFIFKRIENGAKRNAGKWHKPGGGLRPFPWLRLGLPGKLPG